MNSLFFLSEIDDRYVALKLTVEDYFFGIVRGIVVSYNDLERWSCLTKKAIYGLPQILGSVVRGNDD